MNEITIAVKFDNDKPTVSGRELHAALMVDTRYIDWFKRMCEYGFMEGKDLNLLKFEKVQIEGNRQVMRNIIDHQLTIDMAKEICMIQRTEIGKRCREYFLNLERQWNSPNAVMARALQLADQKIGHITGQNNQLLETTAAQAKQIEVMKPKADYKYITSVKNEKQYVVFDFKDKAGKRKRKWVSTGLPEKCAKKGLNEAVKEIVAEFAEKWNNNQVVLDVIPKNVTDAENDENIVINQELSDFFSQWLTAIKPNTARTTYQCYKRIMERFMKYMSVHYPNITLGELNHSQIQAFLNYKMDQGLKGSSVKQYYLAIHSAFMWAVKMEILQQHPMDKMVMPRADKYEATFYNKDELNHLFEVFKGDRLELVVHIAAYYGLRRSEVLGLRWDAIDFTNKTITIQRKVVSDYDENGKRKLFVETRLKTNSTRRTLPLIPHIEKMLLEKKELEAHYKKVCGKSYDKEFEGFICRDNFGKLISPEFVTNRFHYVITKNGLRHLRFHDLRHINPPFSHISNTTLLRHFISLHPKQSCRYLIAGLFLYHIIVFVQL